MIRAKYFNEVIVIDGEYQKTLTDVYVIPKWLMKSILRYEDVLLKEPYQSLTDYGKGIVDTLIEQHSTLSINTDREYDKINTSSVKPK